jgi:hypothetical protein
VPGKTSISLNDEFTLTIIAPVSRQLKTSAFPEIPDFSKKQTEYLKEDSVFRIIQHYQPRKAGDFRLEPFSFYINDQKINYSATLNIKVKPVKKRSAEDNYRNLTFADSDLKAELRLVTDKKDIYIGQGFSVSLYLLITEPSKAEYNFIDLQDQVTRLKSLMLPKNCISDDPSLSAAISRDTISENGIKYTRYLLYRSTFYPMSSDNINFRRVPFNLLTYDEHRKTGLVARKDHLLTLLSNPSLIKVKPLPVAGGFTGIAGSFTLDEKISGPEPLQGKSFLYQFTLAGNGNLSVAAAPVVSYKGSAFEIYPVLPSKPEKNKHTFTYKLVAKEAGIHSLENVFSWVYFNVKAKKPDTLTSELVVTVKPSLDTTDTTSTTDPFYSKIKTENNKLKNMEKDNMLKIFTNLVILFMFAVTAVLIIRK